MKALYFFSLALLIGWVCACTTPLDYLELHQYDKAFDSYAKRFDGVHRLSLKDARRLEQAFLLANQADSLHADSLLKTGLARHVPLANQAYRNILLRQQKAGKLLPISVKGNYQPVFAVSQDIDSLEQTTRLAATAILYQNSLDLLALSNTTGQRKPARQAWEVLKNIEENHYPNWKNTRLLLDSARISGTTHFSILARPDASTAFYDNQFVLAAGLDPQHLTNFWQICYSTPPPDIKLHYRVEYQIVQLTPGAPNIYTTSRIESKDIEVRVDETRDSSGQVISRNPVMETLTASVNEEVLEQTATAQVLVDIYDAVTGQLLHQTTCSTSFTYKDTTTNVIGDRRALTHAVFEDIGSPTAPTPWTMLSGLGNNISGCIHQFIQANTQ